MRKVPLFQISTTQPEHGVQALYLRKTQIYALSLQPLSRKEFAILPIADKKASVLHRDMQEIQVEEGAAFGAS